MQFEKKFSFFFKFFFTFFTFKKEKKEVGVGRGREGREQVFSVATAAYFSTFNQNKTPPLLLSQNLNEKLEKNVKNI